MLFYGYRQDNHGNIECQLWRATSITHYNLVFRYLAALFSVLFTPALIMHGVVGL
jgi:hypothetical protein